MKNLKHLNRAQQKEIHGGVIKKCSTQTQCSIGECCESGKCMASPFPLCGPILE
ncbi:hypothetical protein M2347_002698 [Chryseobacterium sp. H1D6B]|uniref:bacteriocin-like protein n=1 Tax=Chryseobacterium sp. H1D6B TaxID=2940588 RepID=UPI0015CD7808|nr:hypothetical protein [Chryseobacterium sp. H1D6B]MDH6252971.1 hypothetical protein [Chryseobacterium sp. H1D6B]